MRTPAQIAGHPIHPMLVTIPIGLWLFSLVSDLIGLRSAQPDIWHTCATYAMVGGCIGAAAAAVPGLMDFLSLRHHPIRRTAATHMVLNVVILALFAVNAWGRIHGTFGLGTSIGISVLAILMLLVSGWLGGKMVYEAGVAVHAEPEAMTSPVDAWNAPRRAAADTTRAPAMGMRGLREGAMARDEALRDSERGGAETDRSGRG